MSSASQLREYLRDPFLDGLYSEVRTAGALKSILIDITHVCNIRCVGCYFFAEEMDQYEAPNDEADFDAFIAREKARGTNYVTIVGGEPALKLDRVKKMYDNFYVMVGTNGIRRIPYEGFENMPLAISVWGDHETDIQMRGSGQLDVFEKALSNYKDDPRVMFYFTVAQGNAAQVERVTEEVINNGNRISYSYYGDISHKGGELDHTQGFADVRREIEKMIERYPDRVYTSLYMSQVISTGMLYGDKWGYDVCTSLSYDLVDDARLNNGKPLNTHFRAFNPDLQTMRRCCIGDARDCGNCFDTWAHMSWIMLNMKKHLDSKEEFTNWLSTMYIWYLMNRVVDFDEGIKNLPEIHARLGHMASANVDVV